MTSEQRRALVHVLMGDVATAARHQTTSDKAGRYGPSTRLLNATEHVALLAPLCASAFNDPDWYFADWDALMEINRSYA